LKVRDLPRLQPGGNLNPDNDAGARGTYNDDVVSHLDGLYEINEDASSCTSNRWPAVLAGAYWSPPTTMSRPTVQANAWTALGRLGRAGVGVDELVE
jgi:hypothetical protein